MDGHSIADFYSHSNYSDIWIQLKNDNKVEGEMPVWDDVDWNGEFGKALIEGLATTTYNFLDYKQEDINNHSKGYDNGGFGAKDYPTQNKKVSPDIYYSALQGFDNALNIKYNFILKKEEPKEEPNEAQL